jgi:hypothetical protein
MKRTIGLAAAMTLAATLLLPSMASAAPMATLWVLHGVPGATVDVCVNGAEVRSDFTYGQKFSAELPAGSYNATIHAAQSGECTGAVIKGKAVELEGGKNYTLAAGLNQGGKVRLFAFANKLADVANGTARVQVRHIAAAPQVDVWVNGAVAIRNFPNGAEATVRLPDGKYSVAVAPKGTTTVVIGPRGFDLEPHMAYQIFATGTGDAGYRFMVLAQPTR